MLQPHAHPRAMAPFLITAVQQRTRKYIYISLCCPKSGNSDVSMEGKAPSSSLNDSTRNLSDAIIAHGMMSLFGTRSGPNNPEVHAPKARAILLHRFPNRSCATNQASTIMRKMGSKLKAGLRRECRRGERRKGTKGRTAQGGACKTSTFTDTGRS